MSLEVNKNLDSRLELNSDQLSLLRELKQWIEMDANFYGRSEDNSFKSSLIERYGDLEFEDQDIEDLKCIKCKDVAILFAVVHCGLLCRDCQIKLLNRTNPKCPKCNQHHTNELKDEQFENFKSRIDELVIKCPNSGCQYKNQLNTMHAHMKKCFDNSDDKIDDEIQSEVDHNEDSRFSINFTIPEINPDETPAVETTKSPKRLNIVLVGPTGCGKSTFINAFANYIKYNTFEDALSSDLKVEISYKFMINNYKGEKITITSGSDSDENFQTGESSTQRCKLYEFQYREYTICLFDTPGVGDTRGIEQDKINLENTLDVLSGFQHFHGIFVVLKSDETRITASFEYCYKQLLCQLPKKAMDNMVFVLTHARSTDYCPGGTIEVLNEILKKIKPTSTFHQDHKTFCIDNEAFKCIAATKSVNNFSSDFQKPYYGESWKISQDGCNKLMDYMISNFSETPSDFEEMLCINQVRKAISDLCKPLAKTAENIEDNLKLLKQHIKDINKSIEEKNDTKLKGLLHIPVLILKYNEFNSPRTVCQSDRCTKTYTKQHVNYKHFPQICCDPCNCEGVGQKNEMGNESIRLCKKFIKKTGLCSKCYCTYSQHKQICYEEEKFIDTKSVDESENDIKKLANRIIAELETKKETFELEEQKLTEDTAKLIFYLENHAILRYNDAFEKYLEEIISICNRSLRSDVSKGLEEMKINYLLEKAMIEKTSKANPYVERVSTDEAQQIIEELYKMKESGDTLKLATKADLYERKLKDKARNVANAIFSSIMSPLILISNILKLFIGSAD